MARRSGRILTGETDLARLLDHIAPQLHSARYAFTIGDAPPSDAFAIIHEDEATTIIAPARDGDWARISLTVQSSLSAVGLTAVFSRALAMAGISANIVAGIHHDHIFVPWERRDAAMVALKSLSQEEKP